MGVPRADALIGSGLLSRLGGVQEIRGSWILWLHWDGHLDNDPILRLYCS